MDNDLALKIYIKARATPKVVAAFAERREFDKILIYSKQVSNNFKRFPSPVMVTRELIVLKCTIVYIVTLGWVHT